MYTIISNFGKVIFEKQCASGLQVIGKSTLSQLYPPSLSFLFLMLVMMWDRFLVVDGRRSSQTSWSCFTVTVWTCVDFTLQLGNDGIASLSTCCHWFPLAGHGSSLSELGFGLHRELCLSSLDSSAITDNCQSWYLGSFTNYVSL